MKSFCAICSFCLIISCFSCDSHKSNPDGINSISRTVDNADLFRVSGIVAKSDSFFREVYAMATIRTKRKSKLAFSLPGCITDIRVQSGDFVQTGDTIAIIESKMLVYSLKEAEYKLKLAEIEYQSLILGLGGAEDRIDDEIIESLRIRSGISNAIITLKKIRYSFDDCILTSPFSGKISLEYLEMGDKVNASEEIGWISDANNFYVEVPLLESEIASMKTAIHYEIIPIAYPSHIFSGSFHSIISGANDLILAMVDFQLSDIDIVEGMRARVNIKLRKDHGIIIPKACSLWRSGQSVVVIYNSGRAEWRNVVISKENSQYFLVDSGLSEGDTILISGHHFLSHHAKLDLINIESY